MSRDPARPEGEEPGADGDRPARNEGGRHPPRLREPAGDRPPDRRAPEEDRGVQRHHAPPHVGTRELLQRGVRGDREQHRHVAHRHHRDQRQRERRRQPRDGEEGAERHREHRQPAQRGPGLSVRHRDRTQERPQPERGVEPADLHRRAAVRPVGVQRDHDAEVEREEVHEEHHDQRDAERPGAPDVAQSGADEPRLALGLPLRVELIGPHRQQRHDHSDVRHGIQEERRPQAERVDHRPAIAPPSTRVPVKTALFRLIAFVMCFSPTSST